MMNLNIADREDLLTRVEKWTEIPMLILVVAMIINLILPFVIPLDKSIEHTLELIDWFIWGAFALELIVKTYIAPRKLVYLRKNWFDVVIVLLPLLRVLRVARVIRGARALRVLRFARILVFFGKFTQEVKLIFKRHGFHYLFVVFLALIVIGTVLINNFDNQSVDGIQSIPDSLWLVVVNAFSGGFANVYPQSPEAKAVSVLLIVVGTVIVSYFTASLASYFTEKEQDIEQERIEKKLDNLIEEIKRMKK